jgi:hypothetical protein
MRAKPNNGKSFSVSPIAMHGAVKEFTGPLFLI